MQPHPLALPSHPILFITLGAEAKLLICCLFKFYHPSGSYSISEISFHTSSVYFLSEKLEYRCFSLD